MFLRVEEAHRTYQWLAASGRVHHVAQPIAHVFGVKEPFLPSMVTAPYDREKQCPRAVQVVTTMQERTWAAVRSESPLGGARLSVAATDNAVDLRAAHLPNAHVAFAGANRRIRGVASRSYTRNRRRNRLAAHPAEIGYVRARARGSAAAT
jgi:hypothetical protein